MIISREIEIKVNNWQDMIFQNSRLSYLMKQSKIHWQQVTKANLF